MSFHHEAEFDTSPEQLWEWLERPGAFGRLTPPWQPISLVSEADNLRDGTAELKVLGVPWTAQHQASGYEQGHRFVDQLVTPIPGVTAWRHEHLVEIGTESGTRMTDRITTPVPDALLRSIFRYRTEQVRDDLAAHARYSTTPLTIAVTGANGMIGGALVSLLAGGGHHVIRLLRKGIPTDRIEQRIWDPQQPEEGLLDGVDVVVHLAGAPILGRFTDGHKRAIRESRVGPTRLLAEAAAAAGVRTFVSGSAIGYYGPDRGAEELTEQSERGSGFLADVVSDWEQDARDGAGDMRLVLVRTGVVLSASGGMLRLLHPMFAAGLGGPLGSGKQWFSWISLDDMVEILLHAITDESISGPINATAPEPVPYRQFARTLGGVLHRPAILPVPPLGPRLLLGRDGSTEFAEADQRVLPAALTAAGHVYRHPTIEAALAHSFGRPER